MIGCGMVSLTRRALLGGMAASGVAATAAPVSSNWSNLRGAFSVPDWFRDAKFGIWAHWSAQCVPEAGDWYGRLMYVQGHPMYAHHLAHRSEEHTSELQSLMRISYAVFCLKKKNTPK